MLFRNAFVSGTVLMSVFFVQACESTSSADVEQTSDVSTLLKTPELAQAYNYCHWAFSQGGKEQNLPDYEAKLDRDTTTLSSAEWIATALVNAGTRVAQNAKTQKDCDSIFKTGTKTFERNYKKSLASHWKQAKYDESTDPKIAAIQETFSQHWVEDQAARRVYLEARTEDKTGVEYWTRQLAVVQAAKADSSSTQFMTALLDEYDWIDIHRFGPEVSMAAWLMVQHADSHVELQKLALGRMEAYLENGGVDKGNYAFLWDRVAVNSGRKQRYGTQPTWECTPEGNLTLQPLEDPDNVNSRRAAMNLDTVEEGLAEMAQSVCG